MTPNGSTHRWAGAGDSRGRGSPRVNSAFAFDTSSPSPPGLPGVSRAPSLLRLGSGPSSPRGTFGVSASSRTPGAIQTAADKRATLLYEKEMREAERKKWQEQYARDHQASGDATGAVAPLKADVPPSALPPFDPKDPLKSLDLTGSSSSLESQLSRFTPQQLEAIRRETINGALGMEVSSADPQAHVGMSKFFRATLQKALGGEELWKLALDIHAHPQARKGAEDDPLKGISLSSMSLKAHMSLFGEGALTDSDGRPIDAFGNYLDLGRGDSAGDQRALAISPFPPKCFFLAELVEKYEAELREQLKKDHEQRVREYEDVVQVLKRHWQAEMSGLHFQDAQERMSQKAKKAVDDAAFLGKAVQNQWNID